jgi:DNA-binding MarR family transcriptional regulator
MDKSLSSELIEVMGNMRKLTIKYHCKRTLYPGEYMMLRIIYNSMEEKRKNGIDGPGLKVGDLGDMMHSTKPATSKMLKNVEDKGYIERVIDSNDRRVVYVKLSQEGEAIIKHSLDTMLEFADNTIQKLGEEDAKELIRIMKKLYQTMSEVSQKNTD